MQGLIAVELCAAQCQERPALLQQMGRGCCLRLLIGALIVTISAAAD